MNADLKENRSAKFSMHGQKDRKNTLRTVKSPRSK